MKIEIKRITKQIIYIIIVLMLCNFITPKITYAASDKDSGVIFAPISKFITFLCDSVMQFLQDNFVTTEKIKQEDGTYIFQYSPAIIFSGTVPAFDINFIEPNPDVRNTNNFDAYIRNMEESYYEYVNNNTPDGMKLIQFNSKEEYDNAIKNIEDKEERKQYQNTHTGFGFYSGTVVYYYEYTKDEKNFLGIDFFSSSVYTYVDTISGVSYINEYYYHYNVDDIELIEENLAKMNTVASYESIANKLQPTIATWYNALRKIALVGLLSVLVYIGIQIIITSASGKENSKYKKMLTDWLVALCLLFTLHYIMSATLSITAQLSKVFNTGETDELLNTLRNKIEEAQTWEEVVSETIMYLVLVINTVIFTFQYLKRVLYMAFFTIIAPLISLTYPLDKIKDSKAQAFTMWIKEYVFNALIQVIHLILYYVLVGSALSLVEILPIYGIIAISFLTQGEKIIRKMFGFDQSETVGTMEAVATGGIVSVALNKLQKISKPGKKSEGSSEGSKSNVRTASNINKDTALSSLRENGDSVQLGSSGTGGGSMLGGAKSLVGKYGLKAAKGGAKATLGVGLGATGAMIGFASGVAQGDLSAALKGAAAGGTAGYGLGKGAVNTVTGIPSNIANALGNIRDTYEEGAYGAGQAQNMKEIREFKSSSEYKSLKNTFGDKLTDESLGAMLQAGIKDKGDMEKVLKSGNTGEAIGYYTLAKKCPDSIYYDDTKLQMYLEDLGVNQTDATIMRKKMREFR